MSVMDTAKRLAPAWVKRIAKRNTPQSRLVALLSTHLPEIVCVDVGASYYPHIQWRLLLSSPATRWVAVEPNVQNIAYIGEWAWASAVSSVNTGLSEHGGTQTLFVTHVDSGSSLYEPVIPPSQAHRFTNLDYFFPLRRVPIDTITLQQVLADRAGSEAPVLVKLDTQGTELSILRGAAEALQARRIVGVELESTLLAEPVMQGSAKFWEVCRYLEPLGFELLHVKLIQGPSRSRRKRPDARTFLNECDAVFALRRDIARTLAVSHRAALFAFYLAYDLFDEADALLADDTELASSLATRGCDLAATRALLGTLT